VEKFGGIDVWINNAGVLVAGRFEEVPLADHVRLIEVNLNGTIYASHHALRQFRKQGHGTLINMGSVDSVVPLAYQASYNASKHGVLGLTDTLYQELRLSGEGKKIHVSTVMPWATDTPLWDRSANYTGHRLRNTMMDGPEKVVDAVVADAKRPKKHVDVTWKTSTLLFNRRMAPDLTDNSASSVYDKELNKGSPTNADRRLDP
jgi:short-subunit dehydrogenase